MKMKKLCSAALLAAIAAGTLAPIAGFAAANSTTSDGSITYEQTTGGPTGPVTDPDEGEDIDEPEPNPDLSPLMMIGATDYVFGQDKNDTSTALSTYDVQPFEKIQAGAATGDYTPHFVQFRDVRSAQSYYDYRGYKVTAAITSPFTFNDGVNDNILNGASITFNDIDFKSQPDTLTGDPIYNTGTSGDDFTIGGTGGSITLMQNDAGAGSSAEFLEVHSDEDTGMGVFNLVFGDNQVGGDVSGVKNLDDGVQLTVPAGLTIKDGTYNATVTWTIANVPAP